MKFIKISADEAHSLRKDAVNSAGVMAKGVPPVPDVTKAASFNKQARTATFVMSAEVPDRMGDIVVQEGLDTTNFEANPQALLFHNSRSWPIGKWTNVEKKLGGRPKRTEGMMNLLPEGSDADADRAAKHLEFGTMKTVSIGFRPDWDAVEAMRDDDNHFTGLKFFASELLECSLVPIPALPAATMKELTVGMLSAESKELIKGVLENWKLVGDEVLDRDQLETAVREAEGNKTFHTISLKIDTSSVDKAVEQVEEARRQLDAILAKSNTPPEPKDGEEVEKQPDPTDDEKRKSLIAFAKTMLKEGHESGYASSSELKSSFCKMNNGDVVVMTVEKDSVDTFRLTADELKDAPVGGLIQVRSGHVPEILRQESLVSRDDYDRMGEALRMHTKGAGKADSLMIKLLKFFRGPMPADEPPVEEEKKEAPIPPKVPDEERRQRAITAAKALQAKPRTLDESDEAA